MELFMFSNNIIINAKQYRFSLKDVKTGKRANTP